MPTQVRLGTRGSPLALKQAQIVQEQLQTQFPNLLVSIVVIKTQGDVDLKSPLSEIGGKGVFIKELEQALLAQEIDIAVHSLKDVTSRVHPDLTLSGFLQAESIADALVSKSGYTLENLPLHAVVATGSIRRQALLKKLRPDISTVGIRGNIQTRLAKLEEGHIQAILLSEAGLIRMGCAYKVCRLDPESFYPAPGQGVIVLQTRLSDHESIALSQAINSESQSQLSRMDLGLLEYVGFDCRIPLGVHTRYQEGHVSMQVFLAHSSLSSWIEDGFVCSESDVKEQIALLGKRLIAAT